MLQVESDSENEVETRASALIIVRLPNPKQEIIKVDQPVTNLMKKCR